MVCEGPLPAGSGGHGFQFGRAAADASSTSSCAAELRENDDESDEHRFGQLSRSHGALCAGI